jgi:acetyl-CoA synthetase
MMNNLNGNKLWYPSQSVLDGANVKEYDNLYRFSVEEREKFWAEQAESLSWYRKMG